MVSPPYVAVQGDLARSLDQTQLALVLHHRFNVEAVIVELLFVI